MSTEAGSGGLEEVREDARAWFAEHWDPDLRLGEWWERLAESGWGFPTWPVEWYGRGLASNVATVVHQERSRAGAFGPPSGIGVMMAGPTLVEHANDDQRQRFLPAMVSGREVWCQLFSEPGAGSDLASIQTRAQRDGDEWIVSGQKVWTSGAQFSTWGILLARTDTSVPKHQGLTFFVLPMAQPGVEIRPLREMTGGATFNEVFFTDARLPDANRIGPVGGGWAVAVTTLSHERRSLGAAGMGFASGGGGIIGRRADLGARVGDLASRPGGDLRGLAAAFGAGGAKLVSSLPGAFGRSGDRISRQDAARVYTLLEIARFTGLRAQAAAARGDKPGPEASIGKLLASLIICQLRDVALRMAGPAGVLSGKDAPLGGVLEFLALVSPAISIGGGTDEVQRNIVAERVLGLPVEPRVDRDAPFADLLVGTQRPT